MGSLWKRDVWSRRRGATQREAYGDAEKRRLKVTVPVMMLFCGLGLLYMSLIFTPLGMHQDRAKLMRPLWQSLGVCSYFNMAEHFGTKSMYEAPLRVAPLRPEGRLMHASIIARHGSRYPTRKNTIRLAELHRVLRKTASAASPDWLYKSKNPYKLELAGMLTGLGKREMYMLGARYWQLYGMQGGLNITLVQSTFKPRARESARSFASAWFGGGATGAFFSEKVIARPEEPRDAVLRFFECSLYNEYRSTMKTEREQHLSHFEQLSKDLTDRLSLTSKLEPAIARLCLHSCMYDVARGLDTTPFCELFTPTEISMVEAAEEDMESFRSAHVEYPWVSRPLITDVLESLRACIDAERLGKPCVEVNVRVAHAETLVPMILSLGLEETEDALWNCRSWIARTCPMGGNVAVELYEEGNGSHFIKFRLNERYVTKVQQCGGKSYCRLEELEALLKRMVPESEWEHKCKGIFRLPKDHIGFGIHEVGCGTPGCQICSVSTDTESESESCGTETCPMNYWFLP